MRVEGRRYRDEWLPNFYPARAIGEHRVRVSRVGSTQALRPEDDRALEQVSMPQELFARLEQTGHIITAANASRVMESLKTWHRRTYAGPSLHIVVLTKRCNLNCTYCHMNPEAVGASKASFDLAPETADAVIRFAMESPNPALTFEFQGGEPFLNFPVMQHFVREARRRGEAAGKTISFSVTTNLMVVTDEHMEFCRENGVSVSYSLNGPQDIHDHFRITRSGSGSFEAVVRKLHDLRGRFPGMLTGAPLCVITEHNGPRLREMLDWYHGEGFRSVAIIMLKHLGNTRKTGLAFSMREFLPYYLDAVDYLYEKNRTAEKPFSERLVRVALMKILAADDVGYVDWRNPSGDFSGSVTYDHDGTILPSDESRSLRPAFELGNVARDSYDDVIRREKTFEAMNLSLRDRDSECRECSWNPYCGVLPVLEYARRGDATPRPHESPECLFTIATLDWTFRKLLEDPLPLVRMLPGADQWLPTVLQAEAPAVAAG
jgi:radical SAM protein with 4Fe4S-binding SPASM domain